jgi:hypothetical protein
MKILPHKYSALLWLIINFGLLGIFSTSIGITLGPVAAFVALPYIISLILACILGSQLHTLFKEDQKFHRQLQELEMEAHKYDITANDINKHFEISAREDEVEIKDHIEKTTTRSQKLKILLLNFGFELTLRTLKQIKHEK